MTLFSIFTLSCFVSLFLCSCSFSPPMPKQPDEGERIAINKTCPPELEED